MRRSSRQADWSVGSDLLALDHFGLWCCLGLSVALIESCTIPSLLSLYLTHAVRLNLAVALFRSVDDDFNFFSSDSSGVHDGPWRPYPTLTHPLSYLQCPQNAKCSDSHTYRLQTKSLTRPPPFLLVVLIIILPTSLSGFNMSSNNNDRKKGESFLYVPKNTTCGVAVVSVVFCCFFFFFQWREGEEYICAINKKKKIGRASCRERVL